MKIVIDISEKLYELLQRVARTKRGMENLSEYGELILNGTPLPKGHGRLIDESKIKNCGWNFIDHHAKTDAPTIIEADKEKV